MTRSETLHRLRPVAVALAVLASAAGIRAQSAPAPVRVAVAESLNGVPGKALVLRVPGEVDVVVLQRADATSNALGASLQLLRRLRAQTPVPARPTMAAVQGYGAYLWRSAAVDRALTAILDKLAHQPVSNIGNLGQGRWIEIPDALVQ